MSMSGLCCGNCTHPTEPPAGDSMREHRLWLCPFLPSWYYVSPVRPACKKHPQAVMENAEAPITPAPTAAQRLNTSPQQVALADLF